MQPEPLVTVESPLPGISVPVAGHASLLTLDRYYTIIRGQIEHEDNLNIREGTNHLVFHLSRLRDEVRPFRLHWFPRLRSTNDRAGELRRRGELFAPAIVLTGRQTAGRGRGDHSWWSGKGCLTVTFVMPAEEQAHAHRVPLVAGLAVRNAAAELCGSDGVQLKWPNDIVCRAGTTRRASGRKGVAGSATPAMGHILPVRVYSTDLPKLAGLLCERVHGVDLIGLGLNVSLDPAVAPESIRGRVASLSELAGRPLDLTAALGTVARYLYRALSADSDVAFPDVLQEYHLHHALVGRTISVVNQGSAPVSGRCDGLDEMGRLVVTSGRKSQHLVAGQVVLGNPTG